MEENSGEEVVPGTSELLIIGKSRRHSDTKTLDSSPVIVILLQIFSYAKTIINNDFIRIK